MFLKYALCSLLLASLLNCQSARAEDKPAESTDKVDKTSVAATTTTSSSNTLGLPQNVVQILTSGGAVVVGIVIIVAVVILALPMFGVRFCQLLGNCGDTSYGTAYSSYQNDMYGQYPQSSYPTGNTYQKRSVDYVGPVLHLLKTAYDKYGQNPMAVSSKKIS